MLGVLISFLAVHNFLRRQSKIVVVSFFVPRCNLISHWSVLVFFNLSFPILIFFPSIFLLSLAVSLFFILCLAVFPQRSHTCARGTRDALVVAAAPIILVLASFRLYFPANRFLFIFFTRFPRLVSVPFVRTRSAVFLSLHRSDFCSAFLSATADGFESCWLWISGLNRTPWRISPCVITSWSFSFIT